MRSEDLFEILNDIEDEDIADAQEYSATKKKGSIAWIFPLACAAIILIIVAVSPMFNKKTTITQNEDNGNDNGSIDVGTGNSGNTGNETEIADTLPTTKEPIVTTGEFILPENVSSILAAYPEPVMQNMDAASFMESEEHWKWWDDYRQEMSVSTELQNSLESYYLTMMDQLLLSDDENTVISPLNTYIAFSILAEVSDGNTRQQLLNMLGEPDIEKLRTDVNVLWSSNYVDTPILKSILANSLWLNDSTSYNMDTLNTLASEYYASTFYGDPSSPDMSEALRYWTDTNTGGLLTDHIKELELDPATILSIVSTIYYKAMWYDEFHADENTVETFHGTQGDTSVDMMHRTEMMEAYRTDAFTAIGLGLNDSGSMYFYLPNEGVDVNMLPSDPDIIKATQTAYNIDDINSTVAIVNMSIPKFSISAKTDLTQALKNSGISDAFSSELSDFTPLTTDRNDLYVSKAEHTALVEIDENGVTGAAYTQIDLCGGAPRPEDEIDFILDRPFMFTITGRDGSILFAGIVRNID